MSDTKIGRSDVKFGVAQAKCLLEHSRDAKTRYPTMEQQVEAAGLDWGDPDLFSKMDSSASADVAVGLWLVKDEGIYLMTNSEDKSWLAFGGRDYPKGETSHVVYGRGFGHDADWDAVRAVAGGDDFVMFLGEDFMAPLLESDMDFWLRFDGDDVTGIVQEAPRPKPPLTPLQQKFYDMKDANGGLDENG
jgi:hypothetical protein